MSGRDMSEKRDFYARSAARCFIAGHPAWLKHFLCRCKRRRPAHPPAHQCEDTLWVVGGCAGWIDLTRKSSRPQGSGTRRADRYREGDGVGAVE